MTQGAVLYQKTQNDYHTFNECNIYQLLIQINIVDEMKVFFIVKVHHDVMELFHLFCFFVQEFWYFVGVSFGWYCFTHGVDFEKYRYVHFTMVDTQTHFALLLLIVMKVQKSMFVFVCYKRLRNWDVFEFIKELNYHVLICTLSLSDDIMNVDLLFNLPSSLGTFGGNRLGRSGSLQSTKERMNIEMPKKLRAISFYVLC